MTTVSHGKPYAGNPHVRFDEGDSALAEPRRKSLLHEYEVRSMASYETRKFVDDIIRLLERKGMSRQEFARRLDVRPSYVTKILSGSENFTVETMQKMAGIFGYQVVIGLRRMPHGTGNGLSAMAIKKRIAKRKVSNNG